MLKVPIQQQPDETTCGPTCLHAIYQFFNDSISLNSVIDEVEEIEGGGTFGVLLAEHALDRGYHAVICSFNLQLFDPTWSRQSNEEIIQKLVQQSEFKNDSKLKMASDAYIRFLEKGGEICFQDLDYSLIKSWLQKDQPIIAGLSATYLYQSAREFGANMDYDDVRGEPAGHFVVLHGYDPETKEVYIADPLKKNPLVNGQFYKMSINRVINSILLGIVTYDANLIVITPNK